MRAAMVEIRRKTGVFAAVRSFALYCARRWIGTGVVRASSLAKLGMRRLSMRFFLNATKFPPHPEPVEGRTAFVQGGYMKLPRRHMEETL
jgi:hypothetical protein